MLTGIDFPATGVVFWFMIFIGVVGVIAIKVVGIFIVDRVTMMMVAVAGIYRCHYKENVNMDCVVLPRVSG
ncbi:hypothetical protein HanRHA438_Chr13g0595251 [Helianthus annuus]|nr:hypothetical protein HanHA300_Chr13g0479361 [Helianthus annuus]KAJ0480879.1 hypothetical protein HanIR_Chr13g0636581 [Helianthus annuus]KAJ0497438.1 hypothetical protein HanHA89_Chr13g0511381 [Helianthus annuus]KAJ0663456.1 hypothetical protein HanLR1_Chr13g0481411 [Helianthus annuus]KAJ0670952.1 hypothetical protein HanOQP8_Chr13g0480301 [Helianthus annuus]